MGCLNFAGEVMELIKKEGFILGKNLFKFKLFMVTI